MSYVARYVGPLSAADLAEFAEAARAHEEHAEEHAMHDVVAVPIPPRRVIHLPTGDTGTVLGVDADGYQVVRFVGDRLPVSVRDDVLCDAPDGDEPELCDQLYGQPPVDADEALASAARLAAER